MGGPVLYETAKPIPVREIIAHSLRASIIITFKGNTFKFNRNTYVQDEEHPIRIAHEVAMLYMV